MATVQVVWSIGHGRVKIVGRAVTPNFTVSEASDPINLEKQLQWATAWLKQREDL